jgi:hypothetical protein
MAEILKTLSRSAHLATATFRALKYHYFTIAALLPVDIALRDIFAHHESLRLFYRQLPQVMITNLALAL